MNTSYRLAVSASLVAALITACAPATPETPAETTAETARQTQPAASLQVLSEQDLVDIMVGSCIQSTRTCDPAPYIDQLRAAYQDGKTFTLMDPEDMPDDGRVVAVQWLGGGGPGIM